MIDEDADGGVRGRDLFVLADISTAIVARERTNAF